MLKVAFAVLAVALAGTASAAGWRSLRFDATSEAAFQESVAVFKDKLSPSRRNAFARSLQDIWTQETQRASAEDRTYTRADYFTQLNGLPYKEIVTLADPTGDRTKRYRADYYAQRSGGSGAAASTPWPSQGGPPPVQNGVYRGATRSIDHQQPY